MLEVEASPRDPYVQQEVIYTVRLLRRVELDNAAMSEMQTSADAIVRPLGQPKRYKTTRAGRQYDVFEQRLAVFPQRSGPLTLGPLTLTADVAQRRKSLFEPFRQSISTRRVESPEVTLNVRPAPATFSGAVWLPARRLRLEEDWAPDAAEIPTGEPVARTVYLWVDGLTAGQIPELPVESPAEARIYPDPPRTSEEQTRAGVTAIREEKFAMIAPAPGPLVFPALTLPWWNTDTDTAEAAVLPGRAMRAVGGAPAAAPARPSTDQQRPRTAPVTAPVATAAGRAWSVAVLTTGFAGLAGGYWLTRRRAGTPRPGRLTAVIERVRHARVLRRACHANDPVAAARALLSWAANIGLGPCAASLGALATTLDGALAGEVAKLNAARYGRAAGHWNGRALWREFTRYAPAVERRRRDRPDPLEPLLRLLQQ